jgi:hypothetical protein
MAVPAAVGAAVGASVVEEADADAVIFNQLP